MNRSSILSNRPRLRALAAVSAAGALVSLAGATPAAFAATSEEGDVDVVNTETVQVYLSADGDIESKRVYEQLVLSGDGSVDITNPVSEDGLRNLDGFSGFDVEDGAQVATYDVDGVERLRTVSDYEGDLPIEVDVAYTLDGEEVEPADVVGEDGHLEVAITVENVTGQQREIEIPDGTGGTVTKTVEVPIPIAGSITTFTPKSFTSVESGQLNRAGDGKGNMKLTTTMTLIPPVGPASATFAYEADIEDGVVPKIEVSALPINPFNNPSLKNAANSYQGGAEASAEIAAGATEIDGHLLELRDGAGTLLAGLLKLHAGSQELQDGLSGKAAPGAEQLAGGAADLNDGLGKIDDGAGKVADGAGRLSDGAGKLSDGTGDALSGSRKLRDGLQLISGGLDQLAGSGGLPKAADGVDKLKDGVDQILAGFGTVGTAGTLIDGLNQLETGLGALSAGLTQLRGDGSQATPGLVAAKGGVDQVQAGLADAVKAGGSLDTLIGGLQLLKTLDCGPICKGVIDSQILPGVQQSKTKLSQANAGLLQVSTGLDSAVTALNQQLIPGANAAKSGAGAAKSGALQLKGGLGQVRAGLQDLDEGLTKAVAGVLQLDDGALEAYTGSGDLADGLGLIDGGANRLAAGAGELADGSGELAAGTGEAHDGSGLLSGGAADLAAGILDAADGSGRLADGLGEAAGGAPKIVDGAGRLSKEGTRVMAGKGAESAVTYGELYATLEAGAERADAEKMAFGAPDGATGLTAYNFIVKGEDGESGRNWARALTGLGLLAAGGGVFAFRRRLL